MHLLWEMHRNCQKASSWDVLYFKRKIKSCLVLAVDMKCDLLYNMGELFFRESTVICVKG